MLYSRLVALIAIIAVVIFTHKKDDTLEYQNDIEKSNKKSDDYGF